MTAAWAPGRAQIQGMLDRGYLGRVTGGAADGRYRVAEARQRIDSADKLLKTDPVGAFEMAYGGVRQAVTALLLQQGLRPKSDGGHLAIVEAARAQFGDRFDFFNAMRRTRNRLEYPDAAEDLTVEASDAAQAIAYAKQTVAAAEKLMPNLGMWQ